DAGARGDSAFVVRSGLVRIVASASPGSEIIAELARGELFGEIAVLTGQLRTAGVVAALDSVLLQGPRKVLRKLLPANPVPQPPPQSEADAESPAEVIGPVAWHPQLRRRLGRREPGRERRAGAGARARDRPARGRHGRGARLRRRPRRSTRAGAPSGLRGQ